ncbi:MAG: hypothetical protein IKK36_00580 [Bacteroidales bacterium]|nr:hypothetical protein [Bacteroidales bacterium]
MTRDSIFDISLILISELDKVYIDYEPLCDTPDLFSLDENYIYEEQWHSSDEVQSVCDVADRLTNLLKLKVFQLRVRLPEKDEFIPAWKWANKYPDYLTSEIAVLVPDISNNCRIVTKLMDESGYKFTRRTTCEDEKQRTWLLLFFVPKKQESIREMIVKYHKYAYYTAPSYNADSIEKDGILAECAIDPYGNDVQRIYLYLGNPSNPAYENMMMSMSRKIQRNNEPFACNFTEYEIRLRDLPENVEFCADIHRFGPDFIYTESDIPLEAIRDKEEKSYVNKYNSKDDVFDLDKIPMSVLDKWWKDYRPYTFCYSHTHPLSAPYIVKETDYLKQIERVKSIMVSSFKLDDEEFVIVKGSNGLYAAILIPERDRNQEIIESSMEHLHFCRIKSADENVIADDKNRKWISLRFGGTTRIQTYQRQ